MDIEQYLQLGIAGVALVMMYKIIMRATDNNEKLSAAIVANTAATNELYTYIRVRNGTLERLVEENPAVKDAAQKVLR